VRRQQDGEPDPALREARLDSAIAVPLMHESRLVGTLAVGTSDADHVFTQEDVEMLELLASSAAAALLALERVRLDGVLLAARTAQHELNNQLAVARGYAEMLARSGDLPAHLLEMAEEVKQAADGAAGVMHHLSTLARLREQQWPGSGGTTIDLERGHGTRRADRSLAPHEPTGGRSESDQREPGP
jgi:GAF domain-containing protein